MNPKIRIPFIILAILLVNAGCSPGAGDQDSQPIEFVLYVGQDSLLPGEESMRMVPVADRTISIPGNLTMREKISALADSISDSYFKGLNINFINLDSIPERGLVLEMNLVEPDAFKGPGSLPSYQSWYDYFQGSYGGQHTSIVLRESFLQLQYPGLWIDEVIFYYQGKPLETDHMPEME